MSRPLLLNAFDMMVPVHQSPGLWRHPEAGVAGFDTLEYWTSLARTLEVLAGYADTCRRLGVERRRLVATSATRDAADRQAFLDGVRDLLGVDAEVLTDATGRPSFKIVGTVAARASELGVATIHVSLSHDAGIASAVVVCEA